MVGDAQTIARLKSMLFLVEEALRIADEGESAMLGAKLSDCIDCLHVELSQVDGHSQTAVEPRPGIVPDAPITILLSS